MPFPIYKPRIILVRPSHPGNIGSVARAMKTMGLDELYLVSPQKFPHEEATALATHAEDILNKAKVVNNIIDALDNINFVYATSANGRDNPLPVFTPKAASEKIIRGNHQTAILFGPENHGLSSEDLHYAHGLIQIPTSPDYHSLNLAAAVQIICYDYHCAITEKSDLATMPELESFYQHLESITIKTGFLDPEHPRQLMPKLRRLFNRAQLDKAELSLLRGILKSFDAKLP